MNRLFNFFLMVGAVALFGCGDSDDSSLLRVVHNSPDAPAVDVLIDDEVALRNLAFPNASGYNELDSGVKNVKVRASGTDLVVIDADLELDDDTAYTVIAANLLAKIEPLVLVDDRSLPAPGNARIRVVHGAPSAPAVDVYATTPGADLSKSQPVLTDVPFKAASGYLEVPAGSYQFRVTVADTKTVAIDSGLVGLEAGKVYTAIARDDVGGGFPFGLTLLVDR